MLGVKPNRVADEAYKNTEFLLHETSIYSKTIYCLCEIQI